MDAREVKLGRLLRDKEAAAALVQAGLDTPAKIKRAKDADLEKVKGVGKGKRDKVRARFPRAK